MKVITELYRCKYIVITSMTKMYQGTYLLLLQRRLTSSLYHFSLTTYEGWNFNSGNYLFTTDTK